MDIDVLSGLIRDIIMERDSVTLPSLGVFYAEMVGASFSDKGFSINPPYRKLSFRQRSEDEDNAIVRLHAQRCSEGLSKKEAEAKRAEAEKELAEFMEGLKEVLLREKMVIFPGLGRLRATKENHVFFVPDEDLDIFPEGFGLEKISLKSLAAEGTVITPISVADRTTEPSTGSEEEEKTAVKPISPQNSDEQEVSSASAESAAQASSEVPAKAAPAGPAADTTQAVPATASGKRSPIVTAIVATLSAAVVLAGTLAILGRACPQVIDPLLYTPEEIAIINHPDA